MIYDTMELNCIVLMWGLTTRQVHIGRLSHFCSQLQQICLENNISSHSSNFSSRKAKKKSPPHCLLTAGVPWDEDRCFSFYSPSSSMWPVGSRAIIKNSYSHPTPLIYLNSLLIYSESHIQKHQLTLRHCSGLGLHLYGRQRSLCWG